MTSTDLFLKIYKIKSLYSKKGSVPEPFKFELVTGTLQIQTELCYQVANILTASYIWGFSPPKQTKFSTVAFKA